MESKIKIIIEEAIAKRIFPGCVVGVSNNGITTVLPYGNFTYDEHATPMSNDSIFDVASITKSIPTSSLALLFIDRGKLSLSDKVIDFIPELMNAYRNDITVFHLLTQTLSFSVKLSDYKDTSPDEILKVIYTAPLLLPPGNTYAYCNTTSILLGIVLERLTGKNLDQLADEIFFKSLNMTHTSFHPEDFPKTQIIPTEIDFDRGGDLGGVLQGVIHDESAHVLHKKMIPGSAGLFSTAPDLLIFMTMLYQKGMYMGKRYFSESLLGRLSTNQLDDTKNVTGLGWELYQPHYMGSQVSTKTIGKTGFTGCVCISDLEKNRAFVLLSNFTYPKRKNNIDLINTVRRKVADVVFG